MNCRFARSFIPALFIGAVTVAALADDRLEQQMLAHVEKILVVDSITVDKDAFFSHYRLQPSAGMLLSGDEVSVRLEGMDLPEDFVGDPFTGFTNEFGDYMIWAQEDTTGYLRLAESVLLGDGSWSSPTFTPKVLNFGAEVNDTVPVDANAAFPFMLDDGQTLYFAADNAQSLGGYDIFIAKRDPTDGEYLIPGNIGMPFNSIFDDYMMVLDTQTGVGWWATDRNQIEDKVTIYVYVLSDERVNIDTDDELLYDYASLYGWEYLLDEEALSTSRKFRDEISRIKVPERREPEFTLPMPGGRTFHFFSDFKNNQSAALMKRYIADRETLAEKSERLADLRERFHATNDKSLISQIKNLESQVRSDSKALQSLLSQIYKAEGQK